MKHIETPEMSMWVCVSHIPKVKLPLCGDLETWRLGEKTFETSQAFTIDVVHVHYHRWTAWDDQQIHREVADPLQFLHGPLAKSKVKIC